MIYNKPLVKVPYTPSICAGMGMWKHQCGIDNIKDDAEALTFLISQLDKSFTHIMVIGRRGKRFDILAGVQ